MQLTGATPLLRGAFDAIHEDMVHGWLIGTSPDVRPLVFAGDAPAVIVDAAIPRPDVCQQFGLSGPDTVGFACRLPAAPAGTELTLYGVTPDGVFPVVSKSLSYPVCEQGLEAQLRRAAAVAQQPEAVGIVCWDGGHNPIGRARVLYDIAASRRPAVLICYLHEEFGGRLWPPLMRSDIPLVTIPWDQRHAAHVLLRRYGIAFDTVWICKPRLPSFQLAAAVSRPETRILLDLDDDEDAFSAAQVHSRACYDAPGAGLAHFLRDQVAARTVASLPLQQRFGGHIIRHVRRPQACPLPESRSPYHIGFIGTVRPHKNVLPIARAVRLLSVATGLPLQFHVHGDVQPPEYQESLEQAGAIVHGGLSFEELPEVMTRLHVLISGYPSAAQDALNRAIVKHQVPAKISDALAAGRPVLVPEGPAVADLRAVPGVYLFTESTFTDQLVAALSRKEPATLPDDFTPEGAFAVFTAAEQEAQPVPALRMLHMTEYVCDRDARPAIVLLWKQHDAGLYGRRVEQIARSCRRAFPQQRVIILEFLEEQPPQDVPEAEQDTPEAAGAAIVPQGTDQPQNAPLPVQEEDFTQEKAVRTHLLALKTQGLERDGILLQTLRYTTPQELRAALLTFLVREELTPDNALFVLFPIIEALEYVEDMLRPYERIIDVVDNQLSWAQDDVRRCRLLDQYFRLLAPARQVVFNAEQTRAFFAERHMLDKAAVSVIPNWYTLPEGASPVVQPLPGPVRHIFYSGNMNDRLDWPLLQALAALPDVQLHLAGTAQRVRAKLDALITQGAIYHGVTQEQETLALLSFMDAAIIPHVLDEVSRFMNPIKAGMYRAAGLPVLCPSSLGLAGNDLLGYTDTAHCLEIVSHLPKRQAAETPHSPASADEAAYMDLLTRLHPHSCKQA